MTREEVIEYLNTLYMAFAVFPNQQISLGNIDELKESVSMAIKALEQEPTDKSNLEKICEELAAENDDLRDQLAMRDRFKQEPTDEWQNGYDMAWEEAKVFYEKEEPTSPCDLCMYNPPSSADGKPCTMCPAEKGGE